MDNIYENNKNNPKQQQNIHNLERYIRCIQDYMCTVYVCWKRRRKWESSVKKALKEIGRANVDWI